MLCFVAGAVAADVLLDLTEALTLGDFYSSRPSSDPVMSLAAGELERLAADDDSNPDLDTCIHFAWLPLIYGGLSGGKFHQTASQVLRSGLGVFIGRVVSILGHHIKVRSICVSKTCSGIRGFFIFGISQGGSFCELSPKFVFREHLCWAGSVKASIHTRVRVKVFSFCI